MSSKWKALFDDMTLFLNASETIIQTVPTARTAAAQFQQGQFVSAMDTIELQTHIAGERLQRIQAECKQAMGAYDPEIMRRWLDQQPAAAELWQRCKTAGELAKAELTLLQEMMQANQAFFNQVKASASPYDPELRSESDAPKLYGKRGIISGSE
ncbi:hypothetical protein [Ferrimonas marina]|uniref:Flagella synthesis protein FlgN n=1 Tax=Ferrimonas marina TaxID=299255 RepID=A0A1M5TFA0_9GAMM|nr:hypothetical protein [Ferrimonas marina]SHH49358.1 hypothetical protein SAMN02745129_2119 [Ferrimonas marina]